LSDPTRRLIFERVAKKPTPVGRLAAGLSVSRPAVSQHLRVLRRAGLVTCSREGTRSVYRIDSRGVEAMRAYLDRFWDRALEASKAAAEAESECRGSSRTQQRTEPKEKNHADDDETRPRNVLLGRARNDERQGRQGILQPSARVDVRRHAGWTRH